uniref:(northern house mosquito) hypothetical protein n=1 Tax=Culex pipiens TaxID=7175 RepID=A0A8D8D5M8_CULPI
MFRTSRRLASSGSAGTRLRRFSLRRIPICSSWAATKVRSSCGPLGILPAAMAIRFTRWTSSPNILKRCPRWTCSTGTKTSWSRDRTTVASKCGCTGPIWPPLRP